MAHAPFSSFKELNHSLGKNKKYFILDLGETRSGTFNFFAKYQCKIHFESLSELIYSQHKSPSHSFSDELDKIFDEKSFSATFDVILTWDLFNFLSLDEIVILFNKIAPFCSPETLIHAILYSGKRKPKQPARCQIIDQTTVDYQHDDIVVSDTTPHTTLSLLKRLPACMLESHFSNSSILTHRISEVIIRYVPQMENKEKTLLERQYTTKNSSLYQHQEQLSLAGREKHISPALGHIYQHLRLTTNSRVADLGMNADYNRNQLLEYAQSIIPEDISSKIHWNEHGAKCQLTPQTLRYDKSTKFDAILLWDIFNFLTFDDLKSIGDRLIQHCNKGTLIYILGYSNNYAPSRPQSFILDREGHTNVKKKPIEDNDRSPLNAVRLLRSFDKTKIKRSFIFQPGMQKGYSEYLLEYTG